MLNAITGDMGGSFVIVGGRTGESQLFTALDTSIIKVATIIRVDVETTGLMRWARVYYRLSL